MSWIGYLAKLLPFNQLRDKVFVPPLPTDSTEIVPVDHYFPELKGLPIPFLKLDAQSEIERTTRTAKIIRALVESELFLRSMTSYCVPDLTKSQRAIWENALHNPLVLTLHQTKIGALKATFDFGQRQWKAGASSLNCEVTLKPGVSEGQLELVSISDDDKTYLPGDPKWNTMLDIATCAASTQTTFKEHFLFSHILTSQTIHVVATHYLQQDHPIYQLIYIHSNAICWVNVCKGIPLLQASFTKDFSFADGELKNYFADLADQYDLYALNPYKRYEKAGLAVKSRVYDEAFTCWDIFADYVRAWIEETYPSHINLDKDPQLVAFWTACNTYPYLSLGALTRKNLREVLTIFIWSAICHHDIVGDEADELMEVTNLMVPLDKTDKKSTRARDVGTVMFGSFIFPVASQVPTLKLLSGGWISYLTNPYRSIALNMQKAILKAGYTSLELSCNK